jgi:hypothetical protein
MKLNCYWFGCYSNVHARNSLSLGIYFKGLMLKLMLEFECNRFFKYSAHTDSFLGSASKLLRLWICMILF